MQWITRAKISVWKRTGNIKKIVPFLNVENKRIRLAARQAVDSMAIDSNVMYRLSLENLNAPCSETRVWAKTWLDELADDSDSKYHAGLAGLRNHDSDTRVWAIGMLSKVYKAKTDLVALLVDPDAVVREKAYSALIELGVSKEELLKIYLHIFEGQNYEGDVCRTAIQILRSLMPQERLNNLFLSKFPDKFRNLPSWVHEKTTEARALDVFIHQGSLQAFIREGSQTSSETEVIMDTQPTWNAYEQGMSNTYITTHYRRTFKEYLLENVQLDIDYSEPWIESGRSDVLNEWGGPGGGISREGWSDDPGTISQIMQKSP